MNAQLLEFSALHPPATASVAMGLRESAFPPEAVAVIHRPSPSVTSSAPQRGRPWQLTFEARTAPEIEPLMGWTTSADPLTQVRMSFPTLEAAMAYARRQGLSYRINGTPEGAGVIMPVGDSGAAEEHPAPRLAA